MSRFEELKEMIKIGTMKESEIRQEIEWADILGLINPLERVELRKMLIDSL